MNTIRVISSELTSPENRISEIFHIRVLPREGEILDFHETSKFYVVLTVKHVLPIPENDADIILVVQEVQ
jgi:hypothetical protein